MGQAAHCLRALKRKKDRWEVRDPRDGLVCVTVYSAARSRWCAGSQSDLGAAAAAVVKLAAAAASSRQTIELCQAASSGATSALATHISWQLFMQSVARVQSYPAQVSSHCVR